MGRRSGERRTETEQGSAKPAKKRSRIDWKKRAKKVKSNGKESPKTAGLREAKKGPDEEEECCDGQESQQPRETLIDAIETTNETNLADTASLHPVMYMAKEIIDYSFLQHPSTVATVTSHKFDITSFLTATEFRPKTPERDVLFAEMPIKTPLSLDFSSQETEIRLLELLPGLMGDSIICNMRCATLQEKPSFAALSYPWGGGKMTLPIHVKGYKILVTANLHTALMDLRNPSESLTLWVDAICINQADTDEKNYQVTQMPKIYKAAKEIMAWIGGESETSDDMMDLITLTPKELRRKENKELAGLYDIFSRPYWGRIWMVQELAAANRTRKACTLHCGRKSVTLAQFKAFLRTILRQMKTSELRTITQPKALLSLSALDPTRTFLDILWQSSTLVASQKVDRIYALRGISGKFYRKEIKVDYSITFEALCRKVVMLMIHKERRLDVLCYFRSFGPQSPSWLRDFSEREVGIPPDAYSSDLGRKSNARVAKDSLRTRGICIGRVKDTVTYNKISYPGWRSDSELEVIRRIAFDTLKPAEHFPTALDEANENRFLEMFSDGKQHVMDRLGKEYRRRWRILWQKRIDFEQGKITSHEWEKQDETFCSLFSRLIGRSLFTMTNLNIGLGPRETQQHDMVCILYGCRLPVMLRRDGRYYNFIGPAYVNGAMGGELLQEDQKSQSFWIR